MKSPRNAKHNGLVGEITELCFAGVDNYQQSKGKYLSKSHFNSLYLTFESITENNIEVLYTVKPLYVEQDPLEQILSKNCLKKNILTEILDIHLILNCEDLNN